MARKTEKPMLARAVKLRMAMQVMVRPRLSDKDRSMTAWTIPQTEKPKVKMSKRSLESM